MYLITPGGTKPGSSPLDRITTGDKRQLVYATVKDLSLNTKQVVFRGAYKDMKVVKVDGIQKAKSIELTDHTGKTVNYQIEDVRYHRQKTAFYIYRDKVNAIG